MKTYKIVANRKPADVIANNDETLESGYTLEEARISSIQYQKTGEYCAVWIEPEEKPEPRITRTIESDYRGHRHTVVRCDGWQV